MSHPLPITELINELSTSKRMYVNELYKGNVKKKIEDVLNHPLKEYAEFIVKTVAEKCAVSLDDIKGKKRFQRYVLARYIAIGIIDENTDFKDYSTVFINKDRTMYYHILDTIDEKMQKYNKKKLYIELQSLCSLSSYNNVDKKV